MQIEGEKLEGVLQFVIPGENTAHHASHVWEALKSVRRQRG